MNSELIFLSGHGVISSNRRRCQMQTVTLKIKLLPPNKGKLDKMARMVETYRQACSWFLQQAEALDTTSRAHLNRKTYKQACLRFDLNRATLQCAMLKALSTRRSLSFP
jgi:putative transposase